jgi:hypothetical protein
MCKYCGSCVKNNTPVKTVVIENLQKPKEEIKIKVISPKIDLVEVVEKVKKCKKVKDDGTEKVKRPPSKYNIFVKEQKALNKSMTLAEIGVAWKLLTASQ